MHAADIHRWGDRAVESLAKRGIISPALVTDNKALDFIEIAQQTHRLPVFQDLLQEELETIASRLIFRSHPKRETLFYKGDIADRMYIIKQGRVSLINPSDKHHTPSVLRENDVFGGLAFLTGAVIPFPPSPQRTRRFGCCARKTWKSSCRRHPPSETVSRISSNKPKCLTTWKKGSIRPGQGLPLDCQRAGYPRSRKTPSGRTRRIGNHSSARRGRDRLVGDPLTEYRSPWSSDPACFISKSASP